MVAKRARTLSCPAKLARVVLGNCGPLTPTEVADEARLSVETAEDALRELVEYDLATPVCGMCHSREEVYELAEEDGGGDDE